MRGNARSNAPFRHGRAPISGVYRSRIRCFGAHDLDSTGSTLINYDGIRKRIASIATLSGGMVGASGLSYEENLPTGNGLIMAYDPFGRLSQVTGTPQGMVSFTYDWAGRRGSKTVGGQTTYFLYSGNDLVCEVNSAGNVNRS